MVSGHVWAALEDIKGAYKRLALQYHPDKNRDKKPDKLREMQDEFEKIQEARPPVKLRRSLFRTLSETSRFCRS